MKKLLVLIAAFSFASAQATTLNPIQLLNPAGSASGQAIVSTGASTAPAWGGVGMNGIAAIAANTVLANATGSSASPSAFAMPSCSTTASALNWTTSTGFTCNTSVNAAMLGGNSIGTSGATVPLLNGANTWSALQTYSAGLTVSGGAITGFPGRLLNVQKFTSSGTYTPTTGANTAIVCGIGGGGGGSGAGATSGTTYAIGGGGGGGAFGCIRITSGLTTQTVTIGAPGTSSAGAAGTAGTSTSFGALMVLPGGNAGTGPFGPTANAFFSTLTSSSAPSGTGTFLYSSSGYPSSMGAINPASTNTVVSLGGLSPYGYAGGYGSGGNGVSNGISTAAAAGSAGTGGVIFVYEYQ